MSLSELYNIRKVLRNDSEREGAGSGLSDGKLAGAQGLRGRVCIFCRKQDARYICPSCNAAYCSKTCYLSKRHASCSAAFAQRSLVEYRDRLAVHGGSTTAALTRDSIDDLQNAQAAAARKEMMKTLRKLEELGLDTEQSAENDSASESDKEGPGLDDGLTQQLAQTNKVDELLAFLTPEEQESFHRMLRDPQSRERLMSDLTIEAHHVISSTMSNASFERSPSAGKTRTLDTWLAEPWWALTGESGSPLRSCLLSTLNIPEGEPTCLRESLAQEFSASAAKLISKMRSTLQAGSMMKIRDLRYNLLSVILSYAYIVRHLAVPSLSSLSKPFDEASMEAQEQAHAASMLLDRLAPFLTRVALPQAPSGLLDDNQHLASTVLESAEDSTLWFLARLGPDDAGREPAKLLLAVTKDAQKLLSPSAISIASIASTGEPTDAAADSSNERRFLNQYFHCRILIAAIFDLWMAIEPMVQQTGSQSASKARKHTAATRSKLLLYLAQYLATFTASERENFNEELAAETTRLDMELEDAELQNEVKAKEHFEMEQAQLGARGLEQQSPPLVPGPQADAPSAQGELSHLCREAGQRQSEPGPMIEVLDVQDSASQLVAGEDSSMTYAEVPQKMPNFKQLKQQRGRGAQRLQ
ncbi:hypothetical protein K437DRAFT_272857 [Tilletiaria anomala UBC 951]|uniref:HIT-type domain-containing protein n=1 Tax=Tilletiaria anomala (strain ATCC 24038 / CBS 436.72 / UBC 951) TaxID=1037660 RepID=A0A066WN02_TILAU|nr:uncharacterized protein K437DRAFT_272857 [Tilletiaria anomala UBC 951]KDN52015.1 hypothetical protein K437DRAFT_272857 [Tilletiaria anomala UBC 951]